MLRLKEDLDPMMYRMNQVSGPESKVIIEKGAAILPITDPSLFVDLAAIKGLKVYEIISGRWDGLVIAHDKDIEMEEVEL